MTTTLDEPFYRVEFTNGYARVDQFEITGDMPNVDRYYEINDLPMWIQKRIAVLSSMSAEPPTDVITGIGRRIDKNVYWVFCPQENEDER